jgi:hypoxanthine phosphoribosyltransferase
MFIKQEKELIMERPSKIIEFVDGSKYEVLIAEEEIEKKVNELSEKIIMRFSRLTKPPILMSVLTGGMYFGVDLSTRLQERGFAHQIDTVSLRTSDGDNMLGDVKMLSEPHADLHEQHIIVVEDIIDRGESMNFLDSYLRSKRPASITYCVFLVKETHGELNFEIHLRGFDIPDYWVVGYGMDTNQLGRGLRQILRKREIEE